MTTFERIKTLSDKQKIGLKDLALKLGFSENYFYNMKNAKSSPSSEVLTKVADYFGVTVDSLLGRGDDGKNQTPEFSTLQRRAKNLSRADQRRLLKIMDLTFTDIDNGELDEDDTEDF
ncbi:helix-turn-helix domain-containing protein [Lactococcus nasutitermitis]|uniref:Helix-turn-helix domain-containing protein n=1 Tax=Lactococcus nasutitermitis TaxID=1652957 RepID=A0ABV9JDQ8_9LACT|nr:helix-turn-helix transcriptional regulator [Lactococcus nasutitermitis]